MSDTAPDWFRLRDGAKTTHSDGECNIGCEPQIGEKAKSGPAKSTQHGNKTMPYLGVCWKLEMFVLWIVMQAEKSASNWQIVNKPGKQTKVGRKITPLLVEIRF